MWLVRLDTGSPEQQDNSKLPNSRPNLILIILQRDKFNSYISVGLHALSDPPLSMQMYAFGPFSSIIMIVNQSSTFTLLIAIIFENKNS